MSKPIVVTIPGTFDRRITPNGGKEWNRGLLTRLKDDMKERSGYAALEAVPPERRGQAFSEADLPLTIHIAIGWEGRRKDMDKDNIVASVKSFLDTIAGVIGVNDKHFEIGSVTQVKDPAKVGFVKVAIEPAGEEREQAA